MKLRKLTSLALMSTLAATMVVPAFATDPTDLTTGGDFRNTESKYEGDALSTALTGKVNIPEIKVMLPTAGEVVVNPYRLTYKYTPTGGSEVSASDAIINRVGIMQNLSEAPLTVTCLPTATVPNGVELMTTKPTGDGLKKVTDGKQIFLEFVANVATNSTDAIVSAALADAGNPQKTIMLASAGDFSGNETSNVFKMEEAGDDTKKQFLAYKITGEASQDPTWSADDTIEANLAWTFAITGNQA